MSPPKKMRTAFKKRECALIILENSRDEQMDNSNSNVTEEDMTQDIQDAEKNAVSLTKTVAMQFSGRKPPRRSIKVQTRPKLVDKVIQVDLKDVPKSKGVSIGIQCNRYLDSSIPLEHKQASRKTTYKQEKDETMDVDERKTDDHSADLDYNPDYEEEHSSDLSDDERYGETSCTPSTQRKYIVFESQLLDLFKTCPSCSSPSLADIKQIVGSMVNIHQSCGICGFSRILDSQPSIGAVPAGNLLMSAAILFSGSIPSKVLRFFDHMNVVAISSCTFQKHQRFFLQPSISSAWKQFQDRYIRQMVQKELPLILGGDVRADTPGHSAKFGSYGMLDLDIQLVQSNEVKGSFHMEKEGFIRSIDFFKGNNLEIGEMVKDRHIQLVKYIREEMPDTVHHFDVWHVAKGLKKKLTSLSEEKQCEDLQPWIKRMCNNLYWVAASTPDDNGQLMLEKWQSVGNHMQNIHSHDGDLFMHCQHGSLEGREKHKKWLKPGTKVCEKVQDLISSRQMKKDVPKLSPGPQTAALEGFHAVINHFAPRMIGLPYHGMLSRITLAALHFNENGMRDQAVTKAGNKRYSIVFPKFKKGGYTVREVKVDCTYGYVQQLMDEVVALAEKCHMTVNEVPPLIQAPPPLCSSFERPNKEDAVKQLTSRYNKD